MEKIEKLTYEQETKIVEYRDRYLRQAASTEPADRRRTKAAARTLGEIAGTETKTVYWVDTPAKGAAIFAQRSEGDGNAPSIAPLWDTLWECLQRSIGDDVLSLLCGALHDATQGVLGCYCKGLIWSNLLDSAFDSLWDSGRLSLCSYAADVLGVAYNERLSAELHAYNEIASSCFALWMTHDAAILCERPQSVKIVDGRLVGLEWRSR